MFRDFFVSERFPLTSAVSPRQEGKVNLPSDTWAAKKKKNSLLYPKLKKVLAFKYDLIISAGDLL